MYLSNRIHGKHLFFSKLEFDWAGSYSLSRNNKPFVSTIRFRELGAFNLSPESSFDDIVYSAKNDVDATWLKDAYFDDYSVKDDNYTAQLNAKLPFNMGSRAEGYFKVGGKYRHKKRVNDINRLWTQHFVGQDILDDGRENPEWDIDYTNNWILMSSFAGDYYAEEFGRYFDKTYYMGPGPELVNGPLIDENKVEDFRNAYADYYVTDPTKDLSDYEAGENITAGYGMGSISLFDRVDLIAGVRYERTQNGYSSIFGSPEGG